MNTHEYGDILLSYQRDPNWWVLVYSESHSAETEHTTNLAQTRLLAIQAGMYSWSRRSEMTCKISE